MKRIGLMGCGTVADYGHIPAIKATDGLLLHSIFDPNADNLHRIRDKYEIPNAFTDADRFFRSGIDAVTITSPAPCHRDNVLEAATHRLPVLSEKPLAMNRAEAEEMIAAMQQAGVPLYTGFCYRFSSSALKIRDLVRSGAVGDLRAMRLIYNWGLHGKYSIDGSGQKVIQQRRHYRMLEGGPMVDCGTHQIDLAVFWSGSDVVRYAAHGAWVEDYDVPDHIWLHLDHANGAHAVVEISYSYCHTSKNKRSEFVYELIGTEGVIRYDREAHSLTLENETGSQSFKFHPEKSFEGLYAEWEKSLRTGHSELLTTAEAGMRVTEIAREATESAAKNRVK